MGELVQFPGKFTGKPKDETNNQEEKPERLPELNEDKSCFVLDTLTAVLKTLRVNVKGTDIYTKYMKLVETYTDSGIINAIHEASEGSINKTPVFYIALIESAKSRGIIKRK